jgi:hypothetical protein
MTITYRLELESEPKRVSRDAEKGCSRGESLGERHPRLTITESFYRSRWPRRYVEDDGGRSLV